MQGSLRRDAPQSTAIFFHHIASDLRLRQPPVVILIGPVEGKEQSLSVRHPADRGHKQIKHHLAQVHLSQQLARRGLVEKEVGSPIYDLHVTDLRARRTDKQVAEIATHPDIIFNVEDLACLARPAGWELEYCGWVVRPAVGIELALHAAGEYPPSCRHDIGLNVASWQEQEFGIRIREDQPLFPTLRINDENLCLRQSLGWICLARADRVHQRFTGSRSLRQKRQTKEDKDPPIHIELRNLCSPG